MRFALVKAKATTASSAVILAIAAHPIGVSVSNICSVGIWKNAALSENDAASLSIVTVVSTIPTAANTAVAKRTCRVQEVENSNMPISNALSR